MTEIVLVGASGWFGQHIRDRVPDLIAVSAEAVLTSRGDVVRQLLVGQDRVVVNAAGSRKGTREMMQRLNVDLPEVLAQQINRYGGHLVHLGSAAEYGTSQPDGVCDERGVEAPETDYGRTKLVGTQRVRELGRTTVLRVFNVAASPPQPGSPLADIAERVRSAIASGADVELLSAGTVRDWVRPEFVCESIVHAAVHRPVGVFNLCSGNGVRIGDAVQMALVLLGATVRVNDLGAAPPTIVIGKPDRWSAISRMSERITVSDVAGVLRTTASGSASGTSDGEGVSWKP
ncbi:NAD(P)-dependent oxidoreductase [Cellulomonas sp. KRMCY2]|uniref:NAD-dependent epimerase/dehydratase family protein n=1 Tax=Cellulomonas sp. KRMCY2 TaxID=1304865 RepID=UPI00045E9F24|nr:NAD(P)-dependent oxidoreductase [Cellulomonas sp. KRMCY2]